KERQLFQDIKKRKDKSFENFINNWDNLLQNHIYTKHMQCPKCNKLNLFNGKVGNYIYKCGSCHCYQFKIEFQHQDSVRFAYRKKALEEFIKKEKQNNNQLSDIINLCD
ncbi:hypothetical protein RFI_06407, partial [Reticulomyxa filosa]